jgi:hypothetical protein
MYIEIVKAVGALGLAVAALFKFLARRRPPPPPPCLLPEGA